MYIEFSGNKREYSHLLKNNKREILDIISSGNFLQGKYNKILEEKFSKILQNDSLCKTVGSGTDGLYLTLSYFKKPLKIGIPSMTFVATANSVLRSGHIPVIIDVNENGLMCYDELKKKISQLDLVLYVTLYGDNSEYPKILNLVNSNNMPLIEDAAQSDFPGIYYFPDTKPPLASILSFDPMKIFSAIGSGGAIISYSNELNDFIDSKRYHGKDKDYWGINSQLSELSAFCIIKKIDYHLNDWKKNRRKIAENIIQDLPSNFNFVGTHGDFHALHKLVIKLKNNEQRELFSKYCNQNGIETKIHYKLPINKNIKFKNYLNSTNTFPMADNLSKHVITIPNHPLLSENEVKYLRQVIKNFK